MGLFFYHTYDRQTVPGRNENRYMVDSVGGLKTGLSLQTSLETNFAWFQSWCCTLMSKSFGLELGLEPK